MRSALGPVRRLIPEFRRPVAGLLSELERVEAQMRAFLERLPMVDESGFGRLPSPNLPPLSPAGADSSHNMRAAPPPSPAPTSYSSRGPRSHVAAKAASRLDTREAHESGFTGPNVLGPIRRLMRNFGRPMPDLLSALAGVDAQMQALQEQLPALHDSAFGQVPSTVLPLTPPQETDSADKLRAAPPPAPSPGSGHRPGSGGLRTKANGVVPKKLDSTRAAVASARYAPAENSRSFPVLALDPAKSAETIEKRRAKPVVGVGLKYPDSEAPAHMNRPDWRQVAQTSPDSSSSKIRALTDAALPNPARPDTQAVLDGFAPANHDSSLRPDVPAMKRLADLSERLLSRPAVHDLAQPAQNASHRQHESSAAKVVALSSPVHEPVTSANGPAPSPLWPVSNPREDARAVRDTGSLRSPAEHSITEPRFGANTEPAGALAELVNEVLIEQARRNGVDLS